jgi:hypothetical protein
LFWFDGNDITTLFQDTAGTVPVTTNGDSVKRWNDKSSNAYHVSSGGNFGLYDTTSMSLPCVGSTRGMAEPGTIGDPGNNGLMIYAVLKVTNDNSCWVELDASGTVNTGFAAFFFSGNLYSRYCAGGSIQDNTQAEPSVPVTDYFTYFWDKTNAQVSSFKHQTQSTPTSVSAKTATITGVTLGAETNSATALDGRIGELLCYKVQHDSTMRGNVWTYINGKWGY